MLHVELSGFYHPPKQGHRRHFWSRRHPQRRFCYSQYRSHYDCDGWQI